MRLIARHAVWACAVVAFAVPASTEITDSEIYALYSSIYKTSDWLAPGEMVGIAETPLSMSAMTQCVKPSTDEERKMVDAAHAQTVENLKWAPNFDLAHRYTIIPSAEAQKAINCIAGGRPKGGAGACKPYAQLHFVRFLSIPIFNEDHTKALVGISKVCGGLCGSGSLQVYRTTHDGWELEPSSFSQCIWMY